MTASAALVACLISVPAAPAGAAGVTKFPLDDKRAAKVSCETDAATTWVPAAKRKQTVKWGGGQMTAHVWALKFHSTSTPTQVCHAVHVHVPGAAPGKLRLKVNSRVTTYGWYSVGAERKAYPMDPGDGSFRYMVTTTSGTIDGDEPAMGGTPPELLRLHSAVLAESVVFDLRDPLDLDYATWIIGGDPSGLRVSEDAGPVGWDVKLQVQRKISKDRAETARQKKAADVRLSQQLNAATSTYANVVRRARADLAWYENAAAGITSRTKRVSVIRAAKSEYNGKVQAAATRRDKAVAQAKSAHRRAVRAAVAVGWEPLWEPKRLTGHLGKFAEGVRR